MAVDHLAPIAPPRPSSVDHLLRRDGLHPESVRADAQRARANLGERLARWWRRRARPAPPRAAPRPHARLFGPR